MAIYVCNVCGHVEFGEAPENCPVCWASRDKFTSNDSLFEDAKEKSKEGAHKHIPAIKVNKTCGLIPEESCVDVIVRIGDTLHPMTDGHFINWIDAYVDDRYVSRIMLSPHVYAAGCFHLKAEGKKVRVVEFCNLHGHWHAEADL